MKDDEPPNPGHVGFLGSPAVVSHANRLAYAIEQSRRLSHISPHAKTVPGSEASKTGVRHRIAHEAWQFFQPSREAVVAETATVVAMLQSEIGRPMVQRIPIQLHVANALQWLGTG